MRKKRIIKVHPVKPDLKFDSSLVTELSNKIMWDGNASKAFKIVYQAAEEIEKSISLPFVSVLEGAVANIRPSLEMKTRKWGASTQRVPVKVEEKRGSTLALRWIVNCAREKKVSKDMFKKLAEEIKAAYNKTGEALKKKENIHKEAMSNMVFSNTKIK